MRVLAISGSLRQGSYNAALLRAAAAECPTSVEFVTWRGLAAIPAFNEDVEHPPPPEVASLRSEIARADAVLVATPEYNGSVPGALKNALDWASRPAGANPLDGKSVAVVGASQGVFGAIWAQAEARKILRAMGADVDPRALLVARAGRAFTADGGLRDADLAATLSTMMDDLIRRTRRCAA